MKSSTRTQYHRRQRILELIREGTRAGSLPNCGHFMRELEVSRRTAMRDRVGAEEGALAAQLLQPGLGDFIEGVELVSEASMRNAERTAAFSGRAVWIRVPFA